MGRYFPELLEALRAVPAQRFVLDGELVVLVGAAFSFDDLLQRIHPAESRIRKLAAATPAWLVVFDLLADAASESLVGKPLQVRRLALEKFAAATFGGSSALRLSPATTKLAVARKWLGSAGTNLDGLIAKQLDAPYAAGERTAMVKVEPRRTADGVVGGFRYAEKGKVVSSLLLGLYDADGLLHHVGFCSRLKTAEKPALTKKLEALIGPPGFTGRAPGGPSRWATKRSTEWQPLKSKFVVEVSFDHMTSGRLRHGTSLLRWRPDKSPEQCTMEQIKQKQSASWIG